MLLPFLPTALMINLVFSGKLTSRSTKYPESICPIALNPIDGARNDTIALFAMPVIFTTFPSNVCEYSLPKCGTSFLP